MKPRPHVLIVGGGFGGLYCARALKRAPVRLTLLDRRNHHLFQPLLYQVATAALNPSDIAYPIRTALRSQSNATVFLADVLRVDTSTQSVTLADGERFAYEFLVLATGATHAYFGHDEWARAAPGLKTIEDALVIRKKMLFAFEAAERETDAARRAMWLTFVVIGGGPTGVELAGAFAEIARHTLARDFRNINPADARIILVEAGPVIVPMYPSPLPTAAASQLKALGVEVQTDSRVTDIDAEGICVGGQRIAARTIVWAAGVQASPLAESLDVPLDRAGRVLVTPELTIPTHQNVYVIGDLAHVETDGTPVPGVAPAAIQMGRHVASSITRAVQGERPRPFRYRDKGSMATIGRSKAVALLPPDIKLSGFIAWMAWLVIHIFYLIGFRNRVFVMLSWAWSYLLWQRGARLITETSSAAPSTSMDTGTSSAPISQEVPRAAGT